MEYENTSALRYASQTDDGASVEVDLVQMLGVVISNILYILLAGIASAGIVALISMFLLNPKYESNTQLYIINRQNDGVTTYSDIQSSTQLVNDYKVLVTSIPVLERVISELELNMTVEELSECISVGIETDSRVLEITVTTVDAYLSKSIADAVADISAEQITRIMQIEGVNVIQYGRIAQAPSSPNTPLNAVIAFAVGAAAAAVFFIMKFMMDDTIKSSDDIEKYLHVSTLALIPYAEEEDYDETPDSNKKRKKRSASGKTVVRQRKGIIQ